MCQVDEKILRANLEVHLICADKLGVVTAAFLTFPCCKRTNMQKNTVQCFGCRIDNLKCVPICTRSSLQMSESFLFTWQIVETLKKLLLSFWCNLYNFPFFFPFLFYYLLLKSFINITGSSTLYLYTALRRPHTLLSLWLRPNGTKSPEQIVLVASLIAKPYFYCWLYPFVAALWARDVLFPFCRRGIESWHCFLAVMRKYEAKELFHLRATETLSPWTSLPIQMWMSSLIPTSLLSPSPTRDETYSST